LILTAELAVGHGCLPLHISTLKPQHHSRDSAETVFQFH
jgi:hypothetical protein